MLRNIAQLLRLLLCFSYLLLETIVNNGQLAFAAEKEVSAAAAGGFVPLEELESEANARSVEYYEPAPADLVVDEAKPVFTPVNQEEKQDSFMLAEHRGQMRPKRIIRGKKFDKIIFPNGDVVINIKGQGEDAEKTLDRVLGGSKANSETEEMPLKPTEDWAKLGGQR